MKMRLSVMIDGPMASGKSLFLSRLREWLEKEMKEEGFFRASEVRLIMEQTPAHHERAEVLLAKVEMK